MSSSLSKAVSFLHNVCSVDIDKSCPNLLNILEHKDCSDLDEMSAIRYSSVCKNSSLLTRFLVFLP